MNTITFGSPFVPVEWIAAHGLRPHWLRLRAPEGRTLSTIARGICPYAATLLDVANAGVPLLPRNSAGETGVPLLPGSSAAGVLNESNSSLSTACQQAVAHDGECTAFVLTTACDQMRYVAARLSLDNTRPVFLFNMPSTWQTDAVGQLYRDELQRLGRFLTHHGGTPPDTETLARTMLAYDRARRMASEARPSLSAQRFSKVLAELRGPLEDATSLRISHQTEQAARSVPLLPRSSAGEAAVPLLPGSSAAGVLNESNSLSNTACRQAVPLGSEKCGLAEQRINGNIGHSNATDSHIPLALVGGPLMESDDALFDLLEGIGGRVVLDATEGGERTLPRPFDPARIDADPFAELADAYFLSIPDVFRRPNHRLYEWLERELKAREVRGVVFRRYLWCDLWHAERLRLKQQIGLPTLDVDVGPDDLSTPNRMLGRIEAFVETLQ